MYALSSLLKNFSVEAKAWLGMQIAGEASVTVQMVPMNAVTNLVLTAPHGKSLVSGDPVRVALETETEDARPLPKKAASEGLVVKMMHSEGSKPSFDLRLADHSNATQHSYTFESESIKEAGAFHYRFLS